MQRLVVCLLIPALVLGFLPACSNIQDDQTRTKTEGTLVGAGAGAVLGAVVGGLVGGRRGALTGAAIGAGAGGLAGYAYGSHVADKKAEYADREEWLDACLTQAERTRRETAAHNDKMRAELVRLRQETQQLEAAYQQRRVKRSALLAEQKKIEQRLALNEQRMERTQAEISRQSGVVRQAREAGDNTQAARLETEVRSMREQVDQLKRQSAELADMSHRMSG